MKAAGGLAGMAAGAALCETIAGCAIGGPLFLVSADVGGSGLAQMVHGNQRPTIVGEVLGPEAQHVEEAVVDSAGMVGLFSGFPTSPHKPPSVGVHGNKPSIWSSTKSKSGVENAYDHFTKHRSEFPEFQNAKQYVEGARRFTNQPPAGTLTKTRPNGDILFYDPATNTFAVRSANGAPRTMFRPTDGINYWNRQ